MPAPATTASWSAAATMPRSPVRGPKGASGSVTTRSEDDDGAQHLAALHQSNQFKTIMAIPLRSGRALLGLSLCFGAHRAPKTGLGPFG